MRSVRASTKKKRRVTPIRARDTTPQRISPRNRSTTPPPTNSTNMPPFTSDELLKISIVKNTLREYHQIPQGKEDASRLSVDQLHIIRSTLTRFYSLDFSFCADDFLWENVIQMRASRLESSLSNEEIPHLSKGSYRLLREYRDMSREGRTVERYKSDTFLVSLEKIPFDPLDQNPTCMMLSKSMLIRGIRNGLYSDDDREVMEDKVEEGYDSLIRLAIRNHALVLQNDGDLWKEVGYIMGKGTKPTYVVKMIDVVDSRFVFSSASCCLLKDGEAVCGNCAGLENDLRKMAVKRAEFRGGEIGRCTNHKCILSTPAVSLPYLRSEAERRKRHLTQIRYYSRYTCRLREEGVDLSMSCAEGLFDGDVLQSGLNDLGDRDTISQGELIEFLWKESVANFVKAKRSGKGNVRFDPVFIKFAIYLRSKVNTGAYKFMANVFNLPSERTLSNYDTLDGNAKEGILHETLRQMEHEFNNRLKDVDCMNPRHGEWMGSGVLKFDEMKVKEKLVFNPHTMELVGFVGGAVGDDVVTEEFRRLSQQHNEDESKDGGVGNQRPATAEHLLLFIFTSWDKQQPLIKRAVARYAVGGKSTGSDLVQKIDRIICALFARGFIVNQICSDGASENVAALKMMATLTAADVFASLHPALPQLTRVAFHHPCHGRYLVFIGGEMPHWIKRVVNGLEFSSVSSHKRNLLLNGKPLGLGMIRKAWEAVELGGIATLTQTKLTVDHFVKNPHSRMRVFLAAQILSSSVHELLRKYVEGDEGMTAEYSSLMMVIKKLDRLIDIWNHPDGKGMVFIDHPKHEYINELESILILFTNWKDAAKEAKNPWLFFSTEIYNDLCWIVYGLKGVAAYYLDDQKRWKMVQSRGGTDDVEHAFSHQRSKNSNPTISDCNNTLGRDTGLKSTTFSLRSKSNTSGDQVLYITELQQSLLNKRKHNKID